MCCSQLLTGNGFSVHTIPFVCDLCPEAKKRRKSMGGLHEDKLLRTSLSSLFAALQTRPQLFKERIVISYPADIIAIYKGQHISTCIISVVRSLDISCHPARCNPTDKTNIHIKVGCITFISTG